MEKKKKIALIIIIVVIIIVLIIVGIVIWRSHTKAPDPHTADGRIPPPIPHGAPPPPGDPTTDPQAPGKAGKPCGDGKCVEGAFCGNDKMCYEKCVAKGICKDAGKVPRKNKYFCDYDVCNVQTDAAGDPSQCKKCPNNWTLTEAASRTCKAPDDYDGPCSKVSSFGRYTTEEAQDWSIGCNAPWDNPCTSGCCYCVYDQLGAPWNATVAYTDDTNECQGWCYECRDQQGIPGSYGVNAIFNKKPCNEKNNKGGDITLGWSGCQRKYQF